MSALATYLYAVGDATLAESVPADALTGVDGAPVRTVVEAGLAAVVSGVPSDRFSERALRQAMEDLTWLEGTARAHHRVVDAVAEAHTVAPARLVTIYHDDERLRAVLAEKAAGLAAVLDRLRGHSEWGVKAFATPPAEDDRPSDAPDGAGRGPGTSYLLRRRAERDRAARAGKMAADAAERAHREIVRHAAATRRYPPQDPRLTGHRDEMLLNVAYLVPDSAAEPVRRLVERHNRPPLRVELTGPWAAYSFVERDQP